MDFKSLTAKLGTFADTATVFAGKALTTTLTALEKTADFSYDKIKSTPFYLKNGADFDSVKEDRNLVIIVIGGREDATTKQVLARLPILVPRAWQYSATLKLLYITDLPDLAQSLDATSGNILIYREGNLKTKLSGEKMTEFLTSFDIFGGTSSENTKTPDSTPSNP